MSRRTLTAEQWGIEGYLPGRIGLPGRSGVDNRLFVDAILWMAGNAAHWRDLPEVFGKWTAFRVRFRRWSHAGVWEKLFHAMADTPDFEYVLIDSTISKVQDDASSAKGAEAACIGRSRGGLTRKLHAVVDAAYDAEPLRTFIAYNLKATAQIKANPSRATTPPVDWRLYKERLQVECFFNKLKRFRRIALRCEKTITTFMGFVHLAYAMIWLR